MAQVNFIVKINVCSEGDSQNIYSAPFRTLKEAQVKFDRILSGAENYGQSLYPADKFGVMLSISRANGDRLRTMQIN